MIEGIDNEQQRLVVIDFEGLVNRPFDLNRVPAYVPGFDGMLQLAVGTEESAAIRADTAGPAHQAKLDGEPKETRHTADDTREAPRPFVRVLNAGGDLDRCMRTIAESYERVGKRLFGMHGHVSGDIVKDIGLG